MTAGNDIPDPLLAAMQHDGVVDTRTRTPAAAWRVAGEPDPHGTRYERERATLPMGHLTDDELANGAYLNYDRRPYPTEILAGRASSPIAWMTAVKDRIRWLSRRLVESVAARDEQAAWITEVRLACRDATGGNATFVDDDVVQTIRHLIAQRDQLRRALLSVRLAIHPEKLAPSWASPEFSHGYECGMRDAAMVLRVILGDPDTTELGPPTMVAQLYVHANAATADLYSPGLPDGRYDVWLAATIAQGAPA